MWGKMMKYRELTLFFIMGLLISCVGCISTSSHDNLTIHTQTSLTPVSGSTTSGVVPTVCPPLGDASPWIHLEPVADHIVGENFILTGTTNLKSGENLSVFIYQSPPSPNKKMPSEFTDVRGSAIVRTGDCYVNTWSFSDNLATLRPSLYTTQVRAMKNTTIEANLVQFIIIDNRTYAY